MSGFQLDDFIARVRTAAEAPGALVAIRTIMTEAFRDPGAIRSAMAHYSGDEEILFEDDSVSIWYCGFDPSIHVPPHDHQTGVAIGVYEGIENNHLYRAGDGLLERRGTRRLCPGDVIVLGPDTIHSVETANGSWSYGIHAYLAPLKTIERSLFDWDTGAATPFDDARFEALKRVSAA